MSQVSYIGSYLVEYNFIDFLIEVDKLCIFENALDRVDSLYENGPT